MCDDIVLSFGFGQKPSIVQPEVQVTPPPAPLPSLPLQSCLSCRTPFRPPPDPTPCSANDNITLVFMCVSYDAEIGRARRKRYCWPFTKGSAVVPSTCLRGNETAESKGGPSPRRRQSGRCERRAEGGGAHGMGYCDFTYFLFFCFYCCVRALVLVLLTMLMLMLMLAHLPSLFLFSCYYRSF